MPLILKTRSPAVSGWVGFALHLGKYHCMNGKLATVKTIAEAFGEEPIGQVSMAAAAAMMFYDNVSSFRSWLCRYNKENPDEPIHVYGNNRNRYVDGGALVPHIMDRLEQLSTALPSAKPFDPKNPPSLHEAFASPSPVGVKKK